MAKGDLLLSVPVWLGEAEEAEGDAVAHMRPAADAVLRVWPISSRVNNVKNDGPNLLEAA
ncbi:MAG: hypothetical protein ACRD2G_04225 [Terriglobia bacterium]